MKTKRDFSKLYILLISGLFLFLIPTNLLGATFCVDTATELQTALTTAQSNGEDDTIQVVHGTYSGNFICASTEVNSLTVEGGYTLACASRVIDPTNTILDGGGTDHVLVLARQTGTADFSVEGLTFQNGNATTVSDGGGLYARTEGVVTLTNNIFTGNIAINNGGGAYVAGAGTLTDNTFTENTAADCCGGGSAGGVYVGSNSTLINNIFSGNTAAGDSGGAFIASNSTLINNSFTGNTANTAGGAWVGDESTLTNNTFIKNTANVDGGAYVGPNSTLTNNTFTGNTAVHYGGGAWRSE